MTIKHFVLSGGGEILITVLSAMEELEKAGFYSRADIESIYAVSAGSIEAVVWLLQYDWDTVHTYLLQRPWKDVFKFDVDTLLSCYARRGLFDEQTLRECFRPLMEAKGVSLDVTLAEFYAQTGVDLHLFACRVDTIELEDISHRTHPQLPLLQAVHMTSALPVFLSPACFDGKWYVDGGLVCNYPLQFCLDAGRAPDEILGFQNQYVDASGGGGGNKEMSETTNLLEYLGALLLGVFRKMRQLYARSPTIPHVFTCKTRSMTFHHLKAALFDIEVRRELHRRGKELAREFFQEKGIVLDDNES